jgi:hypothetical protein
MICYVRHDAPGILVIHSCLLCADMGHIELENLELMSR